MAVGKILTLIDQDKMDSDMQELAFGCWNSFFQVTGYWSPCQQPVTLKPNPG